ncbi:MAG: hypothetical protein ACD_80C00012G0010 [uncultured bacterium (gcode 4)]|uniref:Thioredoxin reductase n=1 Tax=uncultured bacterium (gcode 4) TaxID=1234023 RepID=K1YJU3_9BACT|nr:MAG: hypothetical protein ACD_80C00012G0010 [uncultured bacterium (gcode 4)]
MENVIIIGSGPAGHTAAIFTARSNLKPLMFEGFMAWGVAAGGQLTTTTIIENFPGWPEWVDGTELMNRMRQQSINAGNRIETTTVDKVDLSSRPFKVYVGNEILETQSLIIATWATAKRMWIPWESKYRQKGISACATCDGPLPMFRNKPIVVIGGWDAAIEEATHLANFGSKVIIILRRDEFRASFTMQERVKANPKIEIMMNTEALEAVGNEFLTGIKVINNKTKEEKLVECSGLFYAIGHIPNTAFLQGQIETDEVWYIITKPWTTQTNIPWVFAAGDVQDKTYRQAITAAGSWCMAGLECQRFFHEVKWTP